MTITAKLALEDGTVFAGTSIGADGEVDGEVCFNTSMTGYQEILTDPSYRGQIVTMTYPQIGNYGVNAEDVESRRPQLAGFVVREHSRTQSNFRSEQSLSEYLRQWNVVAIEAIDTRALVRRLRSRRRDEGRAVDGRSRRRQPRRQGEGQPRAGRPRPGARGAARSAVRVAGAAQRVDAPRPGELSGAPAGSREPDRQRPHVVALDFGMKWNIPRHLVDMGCRVTILPGTATADDVLAQQPDGVFLSNGPGDPEPLDYAISTIRGLLGKKPIFGICLGHQLLGLACGAKTFKLKFGHRGANQPVQNLRHGRGRDHHAEPRLRRRRGVAARLPAKSRTAT